MLADRQEIGQGPSAATAQTEGNTYILGRRREETISSKDLRGRGTWWLHTDKRRSK